MRSEAWQIQGFCLFVGYGRSGHSAIGSVIDAHPHAVISHELNAVKRYFAGVPRDQLFDEIFETAQFQARNGRTSSKAEGGHYTHRLEGQIKSTRAEIRIIGDKKGAGTTRQIALHGSHAIDSFEAYLGVPLKILHVMRNPFDIVAAGKARGHSYFHKSAPLVARLRERRLGEDWLDVYHEEVIAHPTEQLQRILDFLHLPTLPSHVAAVRDYLYASPRKRREEIEWAPRDKAAVADLIAQFDHFRRYTWES